MIPLIMAVIALISMLIYKVFRGTKKSILDTSWLFLLPSVSSLIFWFFSAPDPRFAGAAFWIIGSGTVSLTIGNFNISDKVLDVTLCLFIVLMALWIFSTQISVRRQHRLIIPAGKDSGFYPAPHVPLKKFTTQSGLILYVPWRGDQCWDAPLPCTPYPKAKLRLRKNGDLSKGFWLDRKIKR